MKMFYCTLLKIYKSYLVFSANKASKKALLHRLYFQEVGMVLPLDTMNVVFFIYCQVIVTLPEIEIFGLICWAET